MFLLVIPYLRLCSASIIIIRRLETILSIFFANNTAIESEIALYEYTSTVRKCMHLTLTCIGISIVIFCICMILICIQAYLQAAFHIYFLDLL